MFVQHWKWKQAKKSREVWLISWWLRVRWRAIKSKRSGMLSDRIILLHDNARPILPIWWGISFRDLAGKQFNILRIAQIFPLVTSTFLATSRKTFVGVASVSFGRESAKRVRLWVHQRPTSFYKTEIDRFVSQWDKCINTSGNYFWIKQITLSLCCGCLVFIWLHLI